MGELLICNEPIAALPYYIEGISWNVYSLEELCYYVENNTYLLSQKAYLLYHISFRLSSTFLNFFKTFFDPLFTL